jgi:hypothetical protein
MMLSKLWGRITGGDKGKQFPEQQGIALGRVGNYVVVYPYGMYCDLPDNALFKEIAPGVVVPVTTDRPDDAEQGEPVFFHPGTNSRIIARKNGDLDLMPAGVVNVKSSMVVTGGFTVEGETELGAVVTSDGVDISGTHKHDGSATAPLGPTSPTGEPI